MDPAERRQHDRQTVTKPCKVFHRPSHRYASASTLNVSTTGLLLQIDSPRLFQPGEEVDVVVAWLRTAVLPTDRLVHGRVVRALGLEGDCQTVAIQFDHAAPALARAA